MCITLELKFSGCGHQEKHIRPCQADNSLCGNMVTEDDTLDDYCCECYMLPDPRESQVPNSEIGTFVDVLVSLYLTRNSEAETHDLQVLSQNLPLPEATFQDGAFYWFHPVDMGPLSHDDMDGVYKIVYDHLLPDFWLRVTRGENPSRASRILIIRLRRIHNVNEQFCHLADSLERYAFREALGYPKMSGLQPVDIPLGDDEVCGICLESLNDVDRQGVPVNLDCRHIFHQQCIERWFVESGDTLCPLCRGRTLVLPEELPEIPRPGWLTTLIQPEPPAILNEPIITIEHLHRIDDDRRGARLELAVAEAALDAINARITVSRHELSSAEDLLGVELRDFDEVNRRVVGEPDDEDVTRLHTRVHRYQLVFAQQERILQRQLTERRRLEEAVLECVTRYRSATRAFARAREIFFYDPPDDDEIAMEPRQED